MADPLRRGDRGALTRGEHVPCPHCRAWNDPARRQCWACRRDVQPQQRRSRALGIVAAAVALLLVSGAAVYGVTRQAAPSPAPTTPAVTAATTRPATGTSTGGLPAAGSPGTSSPPALPAGATECTATFVDARLARSARGTDRTSCEFAEIVRAAYLSSGAVGAPVTVTARSPVTDQDYEMTCSGSAPIRCTGGDDAVVLLY